MQSGTSGGWARRVVRMPLDQLWTIAGPTPHTRQRSLSPDEVSSLLKTYPDLRLVEAQIGADLRWYDRGDYGFWHHRARSHAAEPKNRRPLDEFPDSMCYFVSEWLAPGPPDPVLLFEQYH